MSESLSKMVQLTTLAVSLKGKKIRLHNKLLTIGMMAIDDSGKDVSILIKCTLAESEDEPGCACTGCSEAAEVTPQITTLLCALMTEGKAEHLLLDSSSCAFDGIFHAKIKDTKTRRCHVGQGNSLMVALARATTKAIAP